MGKRTDIDADIDALKENWKVPSGVFGLIYVLTFDRSFRTLFYKRIGFIRYLFSFIAPSQKNLTINPHLSLGKGAHFIHAYDTVINAHSIGVNFTALHLVTIGLGNKGCPIIGNNVTFYAASIAIGGINIGNNVTIAAGAVVTKDVPDNCVVAGNPSYIIKRDGRKVYEKL